MAWLLIAAATGLLLARPASSQASDAQNNFNDKYMKSYLPPGDDHYTDDWVGGNSSWRHFMTQFSGQAADYNKYLKQYGGPQADYDKYVSLYASMAGPQVTSSNNYMGKGQGQLSAWNKSMMQTYNTYIPGPYENFAEQATEERAESGGNSVGQGTMGQGGGGGGGGSGGGGMVPGGGQHSSGGLPWGPSTPIHGTPKDHFYEHGGQVGYEPFAQPWVSQYATDEGGHNAFSYEGKEFASGGMQMGSVGDFAEYMRNYALDWLPEGGNQKESQKSDKSAKAESLAAAMPVQEASPPRRVHLRGMLPQESPEPFFARAETQEPKSKAAADELFQRMPSQESPEPFFARAETQEPKSKAAADELFQRMPSQAADMTASQTAKESPEPFFARAETQEPKSKAAADELFQRMPSQESPEPFFARAETQEPKSKAVSGELLLSGVCVVGALYGLVGFAQRLRMAPRADSRDIALLTMA